MDYTKRYQEIILNLPFNIFSKEFKIESLSEGKKDEVLKYFNVYLDLCSEEYYLSRENNLDKKVWKEWTKGMIKNFNSPGFRYFWKNFEDSCFYDDFKDFVIASFKNN